MQGGRLQTRDELREVFAQPGIKTDGALRMGYLMMHAELEGVVCSGRRRVRHGARRDRIRDDPRYAVLAQARPRS